MENFIYRFEKYNEVHPRNYHEHSFCYVNLYLNVYSLKIQFSVFKKTVGSHLAELDTFIDVLSAPCLTFNYCLHVEHIVSRV